MVVKRNDPPVPGLGGVSPPADVSSKVDNEGTPEKPAPTLQRAEPLLLTYEPNRVTSLDREALERYGRGGLLTPPVGHIDPRVVQVRQYIEGLVGKLSGDELRESGIRLVINLFASDAADAVTFDHSEREDQWHKMQGTEVWPIRRMLGREGDEEPIVELGVHTGLLRMVETEDELAFVLARTLASLLDEQGVEHGLNRPLDEGLKSWVKQGAHHTQADLDGIDRMRAAGYQPEAALRFLKRLFADADTSHKVDDLLDGVVSGAQGRHPGVRLAFAQGSIEAHRSDNPDDLDRASTPLPDFLSIPQHGRDRGERNYAELERETIAITERYFLAASPLDWGRRTTPPSVRNLSRLSPDPWQLGRATQAAFEVIRDSDAPPQQKGDAVLRLFRILPELFGSARRSLRMSESLVTEMTVFLVGLDGNGWTASQAINRLILDDPNARERTLDPNHVGALERFADNVLSDPAQVLILDKLHRHGGPEWQLFAETLVDAALAPDGNINSRNLRYTIQSMLTNRVAADAPLAQVKRERVKAATVRFVRSLSQTETRGAQDQQVTEEPEGSDLYQRLKGLIAKHLDTPEGAEISSTITELIAPLDSSSRAALAQQLCTLRDEPDLSQPAKIGMETLTDALLRPEGDDTEDLSGSLATMAHEVLDAEASSKLGLSLEQAVSLMENKDTAESSDDVFSFVGALMNPAFEVEDQELHEQLCSAVEPLLEPLRSRRDDRLRSLLFSGPETYRTKLSDIYHVFDSIEALPLSPEVRAQIERPLLRLLRYVREEYDFSDPTFETPVYKRRLGRLLVEVLESPDLEPPARIEIIGFLAAETGHQRSLSALKEGPPILGALSRALRQIPTDELVALLCERHHTGRMPLTASLLSEQLGVDTDASDSTLAELVRRDEAGEFRAEPGDFPSIQDYIQAERERTNRMVSTDTPLTLIADQEANRQLSLLAFVGQDEQLSQELARDLSDHQIEELFNAAHATYLRRKHLSHFDAQSHSPVAGDACAFLVDVLTAAQSRGLPLTSWHERLTQLLEMSPTGIFARPAAQPQLATFLTEQLNRLPKEELYEWLISPHVVKLLPAKEAARFLVESAQLSANNSSATEAAELVERVERDLQLSEDYVDVFFEMREQLAVAAQLQPDDIETVFPQLDDEMRVAGFGGQVRGLGAIVALTEDQPVGAQIGMIDYLMGRSPDMPAFVRKAAARIEAETGVRLDNVIQSVRDRLQRQDVLARVMVANSFLVGPKSLASSETGRAALLDHLLHNVQKENRPLAHKLAHALLDAQGETDTLALAYVLGQKPSDDGGEMREGHILSALFDAYGVPGQKFKQYLAFTGDFAAYRDIFEESQDNAMPMGYLQILRHVSDRFPDGWPQDLRIRQILGQGSVNIALEYERQGKARQEVLTIPRPNIEKTTQYDFHRVRRFIEALNRDPEDRKKFEYLLGLTDVIEDSVRLEFARDEVFDMQQQWRDRYAGVYRGWEIRTVGALDIHDLSIFLEKAPGKTARKVSNEAPAVYRDAMTAVGDWEYDILLGIDHDGSNAPVPLHANPDFHDGQVLIDPSPEGSPFKGRITVIDPGQAVPIDNRQREYAIDLLRIIGRPETGANARTILSGWIGDAANELEPDKLDEILARDDRMDKFIHLLSYLRRSGNKVPLPTVHWILAINRQVRLGEKIGREVGGKVRNKVERRVRNLIRSDVAHMGLGSYNLAHTAIQSLRNLKDRLLGGF
ncbi:hypothetical protein ACFL6C_05445 [Myxococcota bacterium]